MPKQEALNLNFTAIWPGGIDHFTDASKKPPLGQGGRFKAVEKTAAASGARDPAAVAAAAGRKKYGKKKFQALAAKGKKGD
jgi:hypothetical protein